MGEITNTRGMSQFADGGIVGTQAVRLQRQPFTKWAAIDSNCQYDKSQIRPECLPFQQLVLGFLRPPRR